MILRFIGVRLRKAVSELREWRPIAECNLRGVEEANFFSTQICFQIVSSALRECAVTNGKLAVLALFVCL